MQVKKKRRQEGDGCEESMNINEGNVTRKVRMKARIENSQRSANDSQRANLQNH